MVWYDLLKNKHLLETKLAESPVGSAKRVSSMPQEQMELEDCSATFHISIHFDNDALQHFQH